MTFVAGHGIWIYGRDDDLLGAMTAFNLTSPVPLHYLFVHGGSLSWDLIVKRNVGSYYAASLGQAQIHLAVDGQAGLIAELSPRQWQKITDKLIKAGENDGGLSGIHFDIEPFNDQVANFIHGVKTKVKHPVSVATYGWHPALVECCDFSVLMAYDLGDSPLLYAQRAQRAITEFSHQAERTRHPYLIGLPFVATHKEFVYRRYRDRDYDEYSGYSMEQFFAGGLEAYQQSPWRHSCLCLGICIWGGLSRPIGYMTEPYEYYPDKISPLAWEMLQSVSPHSPGTPSSSSASHLPAPGMPTLASAFSHSPAKGWSPSPASSETATPDAAESDADVVVGAPRSASDRPPMELSKSTAGLDSGNQEYKK